MATYYVTKESICPKCEGYKFVQTPIWKAYWEFSEKCKSGTGKLPTREQEADFWASYGYYEYLPGSEPPSEEMECPECEGTGTKVEKVDLADALRELERI